MAQSLEDTKARWIAVGMLREEDAHLLRSPSMDRTMGTSIRPERPEYFAKKKAEEDRALKEKAQSYIEDEWVMAKEKELQDLQRKEDAATDPDTKRALAYLKEVAVDALKGRFQREDIPGLKKYMLLERIRVVIELGWCSCDQSRFFRVVTGTSIFQNSPANIILDRSKTGRYVFLQSCPSYSLGAVLERGKVFYVVLICNEETFSKHALGTENGMRLAGHNQSLLTWDNALSFRIWPKFSCCTAQERVKCSSLVKIKIGVPENRFPLTEVVSLKSRF